MVIGLQEMAKRTENIEACKQVLNMLNSGYYDHDEFNIFGKGSIQKEQRVEPLGKEDAHQIMESVKQIPLREFLAKSGTAGLAGAAYLIPTKIYQIMFDSAVNADICDQISIAMVPPDQIPGTTLQVDIAVDDSYYPKKYSSGGAMPDETIETTKATLDFSNGFAINFRISNDLIEDSQFDVIEMHLRNAGREMGEFATDLALSVLKTATDGDGTKNTAGAGTNDETLMADWVAAYRANCQDGYVSDTIVSPHECWLHSVITDTTYSPYAQIWHDALIGTSNAPNLTVLGCKIIFVDQLRASALNPDGDWTECVTIMFDKDYAILTGRKRWLRIEKYSEPVRDLVGATVTARQDTVSVYDDSICTCTEG